VAEVSELLRDDALRLVRAWQDYDQLVTEAGNADDIEDARREVNDRVGDLLRSAYE
jgi:hypothetical protein